MAAAVAVLMNDEDCKDKTIIKSKHSYNAHQWYIKQKMISCVSLLLEHLIRQKLVLFCTVCVSSLGNLQPVETVLREIQSDYIIYCPISLPVMSFYSFFV